MKNENIYFKKEPLLNNQFVEIFPINKINLFLKIHQDVNTYSTQNDFPYKNYLYQKNNDYIVFFKQNFVYIDIYDNFLDLFTYIINNNKKEITNFFEKIRKKIFIFNENFYIISKNKKKGILTFYKNNMLFLEKNTLNTKLNLNYKQKIYAYRKFIIPYRNLLIY